MSDHQKAAKLRAGGKTFESASDKAARKAAERSGGRDSRTSETPSADATEAMRQAAAQPRSTASLNRARSHKWGLPRLG